MIDETTPPIGVIGGSGFYEFVDEPRTVEVTTPFGPPSEPPTVGFVDGTPVAFIPRHGRDHRFAPHRVPYRANMWALRSVGVRQVLAPCAVGSLQSHIGPGRLVVPDQLVDRTIGRDATFYDEPGPVVHVGFADPYCPTGRETVLTVAGAARLAAGRRRHVGGRARAAVLDPGRIASSRSAGMGRRWHDRSARGDAGSRVGALLHLRSRS